MTSVVYLSRNLKNGKIWAGTSNRILAKVLGGHQKRVKFAFFNFSFKRTNQITGTLTAVSFAFFVPVSCLWQAGNGLLTIASALHLRCNCVSLLFSSHQHYAHIRIFAPNNSAIVYSAYYVLIWHYPRIRKMFGNKIVFPSSARQTVQLRAVEPWVCMM